MFLADLVLWLHLLWVVFILLGQAAILAGWAWGWHWTCQRWFRFTHLAAMLLVVFQSWLGIACPLTLLENHLRAEAGSDGYRRAFISDWIERLLFYSAPDWVFVLLYSLFGLLVVVTYIAYPPRRGT